VAQCSLGSRNLIMDARRVVALSCALLVPPMGQARTTCIYNLKMALQFENDDGFWIVCRCLQEHKFIKAKFLGNNLLFSISS
jgi:hypothetical protein